MTMILAKPVLTKAELIEVAGIPSTTFNNWRIRGRIPFNDLGVKRESLTRWKYSYLVAVFCSALTHYSGKNQKAYIQTLNDFLCKVAMNADFAPNATLVISNHRSVSGCGIFDNYGLALNYGKTDDFYLSIGEILCRAETLARKKIHPKTHSSTTMSDYL